MAIIEIHPQLKQTNELLNRIANALERILLEAYGVRLGSCAGPAADPNPSEKPSVSYHTDEDTLREELKTLSGWRERESSDEYEDGDPFGV